MLAVFSYIREKKRFDSCQSLFKNGNTLTFRGHDL